MFRSTLTYLVFLMVSQHALGQLHACLLPGTRDTVLCGNLSVYENRETQRGRRINLSVILIPAIDPSRHFPPVFMIEGGPGVAVSKGAAFYADKTNLYRQYHDLVLVDVRGTGQSARLDCRSLQYTSKLEDHFGEMYPGPAVKACYDSLSQIADLTQYHTVNMVKDLEDVRKWMGYEKISLVALSFGTRVAQEYMRLYPESLAGVVLFSPITMDMHMPLYHARYAQDALELLFRDCRADPGCRAQFPDLRNEFARLMNRWNDRPVEYNFRDSMGGEHKLSIGWHDFETRIRSLMYYPAGLRTIPFIVHEAYKGNVKPFVDLFPAGAVMNDFIAEGLYLCVTCTEDLPFIHEEQIAKLVTNTFLGRYRIDQQKQACALWTRGEVPEGFFEPIHSSIPVLLLTGHFDPVTPPELSYQIAANLSDARVVVIPWMAHLFDGLSNEECFDNMVIDFLTHFDLKKIDGSCVVDMRPPPYKLTAKE